jgi:hypothetical protein
MQFFSWLQSRKRHESPRRRPSFKPTLDALEDRWVPSQIGLSVTSLADSGSGSLRAAINTADIGSQNDQYTIGFAVKGTIDLQTPLPALNNSIAIQGAGAGSLTVERAAGASFSSAIVTVDAGQSASLSGFTIANGDNLSVTFSNGGGIANRGVLTVSGCTLSGNSAGHDGGGIWNTGTLTVSNSILSGNTAGDAGGAIFNYAGTLTVTASLVSGNSAVVGGGIAIDFFGSATINQSTLSGNTAADGGAIFNGGPLTVSGCTLSGNSATGFDFGGHHFAGKGGGIDNGGDSTLTTVRDSLFIGNSAELGGAIYNNVAYGTLDVRGSTFRLNSASDSGGAIFNNAGTATIQESTFSGNSAGSKGGGVFNAASGTLVVKDSTVLKNVAPLGADVYNLGALTLDDSTVGVIGP